jgi:hypothetical protein
MSRAESLYRHAGPGGRRRRLGKADISLNDATNMLCTGLELSGVNITAGHIIGPGSSVIADIDVPDDHDSDDCDDLTDDQLDAIKANPGAYRVHIAATTGDRGER